MTATPQLPSLRAYPAEAGGAIVESVMNHRGLTFTVMMARQAGKNELSAQIELYLLLKHYRQTIEGVKCMDGPNKGKRCGAFQNPQIFCETAPSLNDGECDACSVMGGFTTEDEMFILIGSYFVPEPSSVMLAVAALATLGLLARRRRR